MLQVIWMYDGCPDVAAAVPMVSVAECKRFIKTKMERSPEKFEDPKVELAIKELESGRLISYVL